MKEFVGLDKAIERLNEKMRCPKCNSDDWHIEKEYHEYAVHNVIVCNKCNHRY